MEDSVQSQRVYLHQALPKAVSEIYRVDPEQNCRTYGTWFMILINFMDCCLFSPGRRWQTLLGIDAVEVQYDFIEKQRGYLSFTCQYMRTEKPLDDVPAYQTASS